MTKNPKHPQNAQTPPPKKNHQKPPTKPPKNPKHNTKIPKPLRSPNITPKSLGVKKRGWDISVPAEAAATPRLPGVELPDDSVP